MDHNLLSLKGLTLLYAGAGSVEERSNIAMLKMFFAEVLTTDSGRSALELFDSVDPDIVVTDTALGDAGGLSLVKEIRELDHKTPIVVLSATADRDTLFEAANAKIDGFMLKPVMLNELVGKLLEALRKSDAAVEAVTLKNGARYDFMTKELHHNGTTFHLTANEEALLRMFLEEGPRVVRKEEILYRIWPLESVTESALKNLLMRFRGKIGEEMLISVKGVGWRLDVDASSGGY